MAMNSHPHVPQCFLIVCAILSFIPVSLYAEDIFIGKVVGIVDGDTIDLLTDSQEQLRIRIAGIDSPERRQPFGKRAKQYMAKLAAGNLAVATCPKKDRYGRYVCVVKVDSKDIGMEMIRNGLAWHYKKYAHEQSPDDRRDYEYVETEARKRNIGLWNSSSPMPPWEWRHRR